MCFCPFLLFLLYKMPLFALFQDSNKNTKNTDIRCRTLVLRDVVSYSMMKINFPPRLRSYLTLHE